jgi:hypothetical protein
MLCLIDDYVKQKSSFFTSLNFPNDVDSGWEWGLFAIQILTEFFFILECDSQCSEDPSPMEVVPPHVLAIGSLVPVQKSSPERRNQKEIVAGEERPKFLTIKQTEDAQGGFTFVLIIYHDIDPLHIETHA